MEKLVILVLFTRTTLHEQKERCEQTFCTYPPDIAVNPGDGHTLLNSTSYIANKSQSLPQRHLSFNRCAQSLNTLVFRAKRRYILV